jgi:DDE superfamily endonuclease
VGEALGLAVWGLDEAGPYTTTPYPGPRWHLQLHPNRYPHEYPRNGTAKMLTLFHPATGRVRVKGVRSAPNVVLHAWLKQELTDILAQLPEPAPIPDDVKAAVWERWWGLPLNACFSAELPPLRMILIMDNLAGHKTPEFVVWLFQHGIVPLYTPLGGSWLNMTESIQRILKRRALDGQYPTTPQDIITWLEATARGWNADPTPFVWAGKRQQRRHRAYLRRHPVGGSAAMTKRPVRFHFKPAVPQRRCA